MNDKKYTALSIIIGCIIGLLVGTIQTVGYQNIQSALLYLYHLINIHPVTTIIFYSLVGSLFGYIFSLLFPSKSTTLVSFDIKSTQINKTTEDQSHETENNSSEIKVNNDVIAATPEQAALINEKAEIKKAFEDKVSTGTFEDPNFIVTNPGQTLVDSPATLFSAAPIEHPQKPALEDESFSKRGFILGVPIPGPFIPAPQQKPSLRKRKAPAPRP